MKRISDRTWEIIQELHRGRGLFAAMLSKRRTAVDKLEEVSASQEVAAVPHLASLLLNSHQHVREAAAKTIGDLVSGITPEEFVQFDQLARDEWAYESSANSPWRRLKPSEVGQFWQLPSSVWLMGLASLHGNGYVREAAVHEVAKSFDGSELPFLLLRVNDWVDPVRASAAAAAVDRVRPGYAGHYLQQLFLVLRLETCGRDQHRPLVERISNLLKSPESADVLRQGMASDNRWLRRQSYRLAIEADTSESSGLLREALGDKEPVVRLWAARGVLRRLPDEELRGHLPNLLNDPFMPVRCEALSILAGRFPDDARTQLWRAVLDGHPSVRAAARFFLQQAEGDLDFAKEYRERLQDRSSPPMITRASIMGLGETGSAADCAVIVPYLDHASISHRRAAIAASAALDGGKYRRQFLGAIKDGSPSVSREAARALISKSRPVDLDAAWRTFQEDHRRHVRKNALCLLDAAPLWSRGNCIIRALGDRDPAIARIAAERFRKWLAKTCSISSGPSKNELELLQEAAAQNAVHLTDRQHHELAFCLKTWS